jgi:hypothetical protein
VHRQEVEKDHVARLQLEAADAEGVPAGREYPDTPRYW